MMYQRRYVSADDWEAENERRQIEAENKKLAGTTADHLSLLHNIYAAVFQINRCIEKKCGNIYLFKILMALTFRENLSQADIAHDYGMAPGTVGNMVKKYNTLITLTPDPKHPIRKILTLTKAGKAKANDMLMVMMGTLGNIKKIYKKTPDLNKDILSGSYKTFSIVCGSTKDKLFDITNLDKNKIALDQNVMNDLYTHMYASSSGTGL